MHMVVVDMVHMHHQTKFVNMWYNEDLSNQRQNECEDVCFAIIFGVLCSYVLLVSHSIVSFIFFPMSFNLCVVLFPYDMSIGYCKSFRHPYINFRCHICFMFFTSFFFVKTWM